MWKNNSGIKQENIFVNDKAMEKVKLIDSEPHDPQMSLPFSEDETVHNGEFTFLIIKWLSNHGECRGGKWGVVMLM